MLVARVCVDLNSMATSALNTSGNSFYNTDIRGCVFAFVLGEDTDLYFAEDGHYESMPTTIDMLDKFCILNMFDGTLHVWDAPEESIVAHGYGEYANYYSDDWDSRAIVPEVIINVDGVDYGMLDRYDALEEKYARLIA